MRGTPKLWGFLCRDWLHLDQDLARAWWYALSHAKWSRATEWREAFLTFAAQDGLVTRNVVTDFFAEVATLPILMTLLHHLRQERVLLARDGHKIEEALLALADCEGHWKHAHERSAHE